MQIPEAMPSLLLHFSLRSCLSLSPVWWYYSLAGLHPHCHPRCHLCQHMLQATTGCSPTNTPPSQHLTAPTRSGCCCGCHESYEHQRHHQENHYAPHESFQPCSCIAHCSCYAFTTLACHPHTSYFRTSCVISQVQRQRSLPEDY